MIHPAEPWQPPLISIPCLPVLVHAAVYPLAHLPCLLLLPLSSLLPFLPSPVLAVEVSSSTSLAAADANRAGLMSAVAEAIYASRTLDGGLAVSARVDVPADALAAAVAVAGGAALPDAGSGVVLVNVPISFNITLPVNLTALLSSSAVLANTTPNTSSDAQGECVAT